MKRPIYFPLTPLYDLYWPPSSKSAHAKPLWTLKTILSLMLSAIQEVALTAINKKNLQGARLVRVFIIKCGTILRLLRLNCLGSSSYRTRCMTNETNLPNLSRNFTRRFLPFATSKRILLRILLDPPLPSSQKKPHSQ